MFLYLGKYVVRVTVYEQNVAKSLDYEHSCFLTWFWGKFKSFINFCIVLTRFLLHGALFLVKYRILSGENLF